MANVKVDPYKMQMDALVGLQQEQERAQQQEQQQKTLGSQLGLIGNFTQAAATPAITATEIMAKVQPAQPQAGQGWQQVGQAIGQQGTDQYRNLLDRYKTQNEMAKTLAQISEIDERKVDRDLKRSFMKSQMGVGKGKPLPSNQVTALAEGKLIPGMLVDIADTIKQNKDVFGPIKGRIGEINPYDTKAQTIDAQFRAASQAFGRFMEGGVLRREDEEKYRRMFPKLGDTPDVAENKLAVVDRLLVNRQDQILGSLKKAGFATEALETGLEAREVPSIIRGGKQESGGMIPSAVAGDTLPFMKEDLEGLSDDELFLLWQQRQGGQ